MNISSTSGFVAALAFLGSVSAQDAPTLTDEKQKQSYVFGTQIGNNFKSQGIEVDPKAVAAGIADAISGKLALSEEEIGKVMNDFRAKMMAKMQATQQAAGEKNAKAGKEFLEANAKKEGVKSTASGLQYKVIKSGSGKTPTAQDTVKVHYHGTLVDGTVFDSSVDRGEPTTFPVNGVIPGWTEVLQLMKEGDKWQVYIPSNLAYGENSPGPAIGPNSTLIFDVELLGVEK